MDTIPIDVRKLLETWTPPNRRPNIRKQDNTRVPDVDWTGIQYKAVNDLRVTDYEHVGRASTSRKTT